MSPQLTPRSSSLPLLPSAGSCSLPLTSLSFPLPLCFPSVLNSVPLSSLPPSVPLGGFSPVVFCLQHISLDLLALLLRLSRLLLNFHAHLACVICPPPAHSRICRYIYKSVLSACERGEQWRRAVEVCDRMTESGMSPRTADALLPALMSTLGPIAPVARVAVNSGKAARRWIETKKTTGELPHGLREPPEDRKRA